ncbi:MAG: cation diffusion facilitator family transporter [Eubacteriales bacterium]|nr:cation diffusion facilitator family transporter [Eubacteriales bacterium]
MSKKEATAMLSILSNSFLIIIKLVVGFLTGSISIISEALHSFSDLLASFIAFFSVNRAAQPADADHPFGHGKYEDLSCFFEGLLIYAIAIYIIYESVIKISSHKIQEFEPVWGIVVMFFSVVVNIIVSRKLFAVGKETDSIALIGDAEHLNTDIISSLAVLVGLLAIKVTGYHIIDPVLALIVAVIIIKTATELTLTSAKNLLDSSLPEKDLNVIHEVLRNYVQIVGIKYIGTRKSGSDKIIVITLIVNKDLTIKDGHDLCDLLEQGICSQLPNSLVTIHLEPCEGDCCFCNKPFVK